MQRGRATVEAHEPLHVVRSVPPVRACPARIDLHEAVADRRHGQHGIAGILPPVRVQITVPAQAVHMVDQGQHRRTGAGVVHQGAEPVVHVAAGADDQLRVGERLHVARTRFVLVRIRVRPQDLTNRHAPPADLAQEVADLGGGAHRDDPVARGGLRVAAAGGREEEHEAGTEEGSGAHGPGA